MKRASATRVAKWLFGAGIACGLVYSMAVVTASRVYAASCTPAQCSALEETGTYVCESFGYGAFEYVVCPIPGYPDEAKIVCEYGFHVGTCE
jgi:hypothetical protein